MRHLLGTRRRTAVTSSRQVITWGESAQGRAGGGYQVGSAGKLSTPELVLTLTGVTAIGCALYQSYAVDGQGGVWSWGTDGFVGALGLGTKGHNQLAPIEIPHLSNSLNPSERVASIGGMGAEAAALLANGRVRTWGGNSAEGLSIGEGEDKWTPQYAETSEGVLLEGITALTPGYAIFLYLKGSGIGTQVWRSGAREWQGAFSYAQKEPNLENGSFLKKLGEEGKFITAVAGGNLVNIILLSDGTVRTWGRNVKGCIGNGEEGRVEGKAETRTIIEKMVPFNPGLTGVVAIASSCNHILALKSDGTVWAWGLNSFGQCARPPKAGVKPPKQYVLSPSQVMMQDGVTPLKNVVAITAVGTLGETNASVGTQFSVALVVEGGKKYVMCWGGNGDGELGNGTLEEASIDWGFDGTPEPRGTHYPTRLAGGWENVIAIAGAEGHAMAIVENLPEVPRQPYFAGNNPTTTATSELHALKVDFLPLPGDRFDSVDIEWLRIQNQPSWSAHASATKDSRIIQIVTPVPLKGEGIIQVGMPIHFSVIDQEAPIEKKFKTFPGKKTVVAAILGNGQVELTSPRQIEASPAGFTINCIAHGLADGGPIGTGTGESSQSDYIYFSEINGITTPGANVGGLIVGKGYWIHVINENSFAVAETNAKSNSTNSAEWINFTTPLTAQTKTDAYAQVTLRPINCNFGGGGPEFSVKISPWSATKSYTEEGVHKGYREGEIAGFGGKRWISNFNENRTQPGEVPGKWTELGSPENLSTHLEGTPPGGFSRVGDGTRTSYTVLDLPLPENTPFWPQPDNRYEVLINANYTNAKPPVTKVPLGGGKVELSWTNEGGGRHSEPEPGWSLEIKNGATIKTWDRLPEVASQVGSTTTIVITLPAGYAESTVEVRVVGTYRPRFFKRGAVGEPLDTVTHVPEGIRPCVLSLDKGTRPVSSAGGGPTVLTITEPGEYDHGATSYTYQWGNKRIAPERPFRPIPVATATWNGIGPGPQYTIRSELISKITGIASGASLITTTTPHGLTTGEYIEFSELNGKVASSLNPFYVLKITSPATEQAGGLTLAFSYFVRRISSTQIELFKTQAQAEAGSAPLKASEALGACTIVRKGDVGEPVSVVELASNSAGQSNVVEESEETRVIFV